jgi:hypothetical protein
MPAVEELICTALRGEGGPWPKGADDEFVASFLVRSAYHGIQALLYQRVQITKGFGKDWPKVVLDTCRKAAFAQVMWEMRHRELLNQVLAQLSDIGVRPILFKGTALAYDVYSPPYLRTRGDTDLIIPSHSRDQVGEVLESLGFACLFGVRGDFVSHTAVYSRSEPATGSHELDVHWRVSNSQLLSKLFSFEELQSEARPLPALGPDAIEVGPVHALLLACMHRAGHIQSPYFVGEVEHYGGDRLIWLYDIHLLLGELTPLQCGVFYEIAERKGLGGPCVDAIEQTRAYFHTSVPETMCNALIHLSPAGNASRYLSGSATYQYYANFLAVEGAGNKLRFVVEVLFPPKKYMRQMYAQVKPHWLPWLYFRRGVVEIFKRIRRTITREAIF